MSLGDWRHYIDSSLNLSFSTANAHSLFKINFSSVHESVLRLTVETKLYKMAGYLRLNLSPPICVNNPGKNMKMFFLRKLTVSYRCFLFFPTNKISWIFAQKISCFGRKTVLRKEPFDTHFKANLPPSANLTKIELFLKSPTIFSKRTQVLKLSRNLTVSISAISLILPIFATSPISAISNILIISALLVFLAVCLFCLFWHLRFFWLFRQFREILHLAFLELKEFLAFLIFFNSGSFVAFGIFSKFWLWW